MDDHVGVRFRFLVTEQTGMTSSHPYNCPIHDAPSHNGDQYFNITVEDHHWFFNGTSYVPVASIGPYFFHVPKRSIQREVNCILSLFNVPQDSHRPTAARILDFAANMANNTHRDNKYLYMRVDFHVALTDHFVVNDEDYGQAVQESFEDHDYVLVPASESSIEQLEKVGKLEDDERSNGCPICSEGFEDNKEVIRMPCSHLFHGTCIVNWLHQNHVCPLCRFQLPQSDTTG